MPLYGKNGTLLYASPFSMSVDITVSWSAGQDVDIDGHYNVVDGDVGWSHSSDIDQNGFKAHWDGDNTSGGPECVHLSYSGDRSLSGVKFFVHANWYRVGSGDDDAPGGDCTVSARDSKGRTLSYTFSPAKSHGKKASRGDPGACINFNIDGSIKSITAG